MERVGKELSAPHDTAKNSSEATCYDFSSTITFLQRCVARVMGRPLAFQERSKAPAHFFLGGGMTRDQVHSAVQFCGKQTRRNLLCKDWKQRSATPPNKKAIKKLLYVFAYSIPSPCVNKRIWYCVLLPLVPLHRMGHGPFITCSFCSGPERP